MLKYTEQARKKDPSVTLEVKNEDGEVKQVTPDSRVVMFVLGALLFLGGFVVIYVADALRGAQPMPKAIFVVAGAGWVLGILCIFRAVKRRPQE